MLRCLCRWCPLHPCFKGNHKENTIKWKGPPLLTHPQSTNCSWLTRSSSREVRIRVPTFFLSSSLVGGPSPNKNGRCWGTWIKLKGPPLLTHPSTNRSWPSWFREMSYNWALSMFQMEGPARSPTQRRRLQVGSTPKRTWSLRNDLRRPILGTYETGKRGKGLGGVLKRDGILCWQPSWDCWLCWGFSLFFFPVCACFVLLGGLTKYLSFTVTARAPLFLLAVRPYGHGWKSELTLRSSALRCGNGAKAKKPVPPVSIRFNPTTKIGNPKWVGNSPKTPKWLIPKRSNDHHVAMSLHPDSARPAAQRVHRILLKAPGNKRRSMSLGSKAACRARNN